MMLDVEVFLTTVKVVSVDSKIKKVEFLNVITDGFYSKLNVEKATKSIIPVLESEDYVGETVVTGEVIINIIALQKGDEFIFASIEELSEIKYFLNPIKWVNVYKITRHYGGSEEGGWYYNWKECVESVEADLFELDDVINELQEEYHKQSTGDIYSVLGGVLYTVEVESKEAESESTERPYYE